ncbi:MAG TPA: hypothetical protein ENK18_13815, partial [Deltaproteobacteria bacterium]|nr:hypothetical protein [Deltaproteobacteria bacterium]
MRTWRALSHMLRAWLVWVCLALGLAPRAHAEAPTTEPEPSGVEAVLQKADSAFATYLVNPMSSVIFFDLAFWDNTISPQDAVGMEIDGERIVGHNDAGLQKRRILELDDPDLVLTEPLELTLGALKATVRTVDQTDPSTHTSKSVLLAKIAEQPVDLESLGLTPVEEGIDDGDPVHVVVHDLAPFKVRVDRSKAAVVPSNIRIDKEHV